MSKELVKNMHDLLGIKSPSEIEFKKAQEVREEIIKGFIEGMNNPMSLKEISSNKKCIETMERVISNCFGSLNTESEEEEK